MKAFTQEMIGAVATLPSYTAMRDYLRAVSSTANDIAQILDQSIQTFDLLGRVATQEEHSAIEARIMGIVASQPDTDSYA